MVYVAYVGTADDWAGGAGNGTGTPLNSFAAFESARASCDSDARCVGIKSNGDRSQWRTFAGSLVEGTTAKVRLNGDAINSWVLNPS